MNFDDLFLSPEEYEKYKLIKLEAKFIKEPDELLFNMEIEYYNLLDVLKRKKAEILSYKEYLDKKSED